MVKKVQLSDILRAARVRIAEKKNDYLCLAISDIKRGTPAQRHALVNWIRILLKGYPSYWTWVRNENPQRFKEMLKVRGSFRAGRLAWIDWMIAECEKKEVAHD